ASTGRAGSSQSTTVNRSYPESVPHACSVGVGRVFFFFQAEDGIRDFHVTGVQTCALPILLGAHEIGYIKWDQNRDLLESATRATGRAAVHDQTRAAYRLMDELRAAHPGLEIEEIGRAHV